MFNLIFCGKLNTGGQLGINLGARWGVPVWSLALGRVAQVPSLGPVMPSAAREVPGHSEYLSKEKSSGQCASVDHCSQPDVCRSKGSLGDEVTVAISKGTGQHDSRQVLMF